MKNKNNMERRLFHYEKTVSDLEVKLATERSISENLGFHTRISAEADRTRKYEVAELENKERELKARISAG